MELDFGPEAAQFRGSIREWIDQNAPHGMAEMTD
jgi:hypothetical protein